MKNAALLSVVLASLGCSTGTAEVDSSEHSAGPVATLPDEVERAVAVTPAACNASAFEGVFDVAPTKVEGDRGYCATNAEKARATGTYDGKHGYRMPIRRLNPDEFTLGEPSSEPDPVWPLAMNECALVGPPQEYASRVELADGTSVSVQTSGKQKITLRDGGLVLEQRMRVTSETDATSFPCTMTVTWIGTKVRP